MVSNFFTSGFSRSDTLPLHRDRYNLEANFWPARKENRIRRGIIIGTIVSALTMTAFIWFFTAHGGHTSTPVSTPLVTKAQGPQMVHQIERHVPTVLERDMFTTTMDHANLESSPMIKRSSRKTKRDVISPPRVLVDVSATATIPYVPTVSAPISATIMSALPTNITNNETMLAKRMLPEADKALRTDWLRWCNLMLRANPAKQWASGRMGPKDKIGTKFDCLGKQEFEWADRKEFNYWQEWDFEIMKDIQSRRERDWLIKVKFAPKWVQDYWQEQYRKKKGKGKEA